ncbi:exo-beta-N-acetylmuramidase NamZ domain-containing protein [Bacillus sp. FJAT-29814]|uniref:exo-beta-N-acetylmuramidase NamZ family protein n=1 Tax=Bacillus sp. FJAT-29814 TaxID=1729688 RepID=UPI0008295BEB|nr:exo-beta-N-acetylmuramidase NamZ domain-containing protein [Bacillus sp. FJAT-29814]
MKKWLTGIITLLLVLSTVTAAIAQNGKEKQKGKFRLGVEVLLKDQIDLLKGKRVGLITNPTGVDQELNSIVDLFYTHKDFQLTALYGPEHGVRGSAPAGAYVESYVDEKTGLPVYSLYGKTQKPSPEMLSNVDVLVFDIQDVGARFYTYIYTMALAMEAAKEQNIPFIVLDRPNPVSGSKVEGPILESKYSSFVGKYAIPVRHGMTVGELAKLFNKEFGIGANLTVVEMEGWNRSLYYDDTPLHFVMPSPNMPTLDTALVYTGAALIEGADNVSEGRGTTRPFELIGAPFIDGDELAAELNALNLPGVKFRSASFIPTTSKNVSKLNHGIQIHVTNRNAFKPFETGLHIVKTIHDMYPNDFKFRARDSKGVSHFDLLVGNGWVRDGIEAGKSIEEMKKQWQPELDKFMDVREQYLLY